MGACHVQQYTQPSGEGAPDKALQEQSRLKLSDFCRANNVSEAAFKTWLKKYGAEGLSGLYRSKKTPSLLPEGVDETEETLRRELIKTRIELERLKKGYIRIPREDGTPGEFVPVSEKSARSSRRSRRSSL